MTHPIFKTTRVVKQCGPYFTPGSVPPCDAIEALVDIFKKKPGKPVVDSARMIRPKDDGWVIEIEEDLKNG